MRIASTRSALFSAPIPRVRASAIASSLCCSLAASQVITIALNASNPQQRTRPPRVSSWSLVTAARTASRPPESSMHCVSSASLALANAWYKT
eukprot:2427859-Rhodomonas_salina.1